MKELLACCHSKPSRLEERTQGASEHVLKLLGKMPLESPFLWQRPRCCVRPGSLKGGILSEPVGG